MVLKLFGEDTVHPRCAIFANESKNNNMIIRVTPQHNCDIDLGSTPLSKEVLEEILRQRQGSGVIHIKTVSGPVFRNEILTLTAEKNSIIVSFPNNVNKYSVRHGKTFNNVCSFIMDNYERLSWTGFHYAEPPEFLGDNPRNLDELCMYYRRIRRTRARIQMEEKEFVLGRFRDFIFEELKSYSERLEMPFKKLTVRNFRKSRASGRSIANTDGRGNINFNKGFLYDDADSIRGSLVHELCHSQNGGHGKEFSLILENSLLKLGLITRPCAWSEHLSMPNGARFPLGEYCPGYNFVKGIKGDYENFLYNVRMPRGCSTVKD